MSADTEHVFDDVPVTAAVDTPRASPEKIVGIANEIWKKIKGSGIKKEEESRNDRLLAKLQDEYKDFQRSFPLVLRWMVQARKYKSKAFDIYLRKHASADLTSREGFLRLQAEYLVLMMREDYPHISESAVKQYREEISKQLIDEDTAFMKMQEEAAETIKKMDADINKDRRAKLFEYLMAQKVARERERSLALAGEPESTSQ